VRLYNLLVPTGNRIPIVASLPHSGTYVPRNVRKQFKQDFGPILSPVDWYLERLYEFLPELGITMLQATHSRYVVNLNRSLETPRFGPERSSVVSEATCFGRPLYDREPTQAEVEERIDRYYVPYHRRLAKMLKKTVRDFGRVYLLDLHSYYRGPEVDVCLGNVNETTCSESFIGSFENAFLKHGFNVVRNELWVGGHITRHYADVDNTEAMQIEVRFPAYLEGSTFEEDEVPDWDSDKFREAKKRLRQVFSDVIKELF
jgi:N-formylglutamate deformylase